MTSMAMAGAVAGFVLSLAPLSFFAAWFWRRQALRRQWVDLPDARRLNVVPVPRGGGIGVLVVLLVGLGTLIGLPGRGWLAIGLLVTAGAGLLDDVRPMRALPKLLLQVIGAVPLAWFWPLFPETLGPLAGGVLAWFLVVSLVNVWNFMDGSDGLAAGQGLLLGLTAFLLLRMMDLSGPSAWGVPLSMFALALAAGCLGFLPLNFPRARLFLGDVGSYAIGYAVAAIILMGVRIEGLSPWLPWLPVSAFLVDAGLTLAGRIIRGQKFWLGHREHLYQRAIAHGWSHPRTCAAYAAWTVASSALALWLAAKAPHAAPGTVLGVYAAGILLYVWAGRRWPRPDRETESLQ